MVGGVAKHSAGSSGLSESKLQSILSYLDEVERAESERPSQAREGGGTTEQLEEATAVATDVTTTILSQRMEIDNKNKSVPTWRGGYLYKCTLTLCIIAYGMLKLCHLYGVVCVCV